MTHISINNKYKLKKYVQEPSLKPRGIWYSYYNRWLKFLMSDSGLINSGDILYVYNVNIKASANILHISTSKEYHGIFGKKINWKNKKWIKIARTYDGIYFDYVPWINNHIDVKSGCIWNNDVIKLKYKKRLTIK